MASKLEMWQIFLLFLSIIASAEAKAKELPLVLTEDRWMDMLEGEWLVKFYAPWCPACKALASTWENVAGWSDDLGIKVAHVDLTENPGLSGRFLITSLPTIYHVKDGEFRLYRGSRDESEIIAFVDDKKWKDVDPVSWYFNPNSCQMSALSGFFKLSIAIRDLHNKMTADYGIPVWGSYTIFALITIIFGLILGLIFVCLCDFVCPPKRQHYPSNGRLQTKQDSTSNIPDDESDVVEDDRYDALDPQRQPDVRPKSAARQRRVQRAD